MCSGFDSQHLILNLHHNSLVCFTKMIDCNCSWEAKTKKNPITSSCDLHISLLVTTKLQRRELHSAWWLEVCLFSSRIYFCRVCYIRGDFWKTSLDISCVAAGSVGVFVSLDERRAQGKQISGRKPSTHVGVVCVDSYILTRAVKRLQGSCGLIAINHN